MTLLLYYGLYVLFLLLKQLLIISLSFLIQIQMFSSNADLSYWCPIGHAWQKVQYYFYFHTSVETRNAEKKQLTFYHKSTECKHTIMGLYNLMYTIISICVSSVYVYSYFQEIKIIISFTIRHWRDIYYLAESMFLMLLLLLPAPETIPCFK